jgi:transcriptional regulator GlxA family with amidase domain
VLVSVAPGVGFDIIGSCHFYVAKATRIGHLAVQFSLLVSRSRQPTAQAMGAKRVVPVAHSSRLAGRSRKRPSQPARVDALARITAFLEIDRTTKLSLAELRRVAGVSERTLRTLFLQAFGLSPKRYLRLRKLHAIRTALAMADPRHETVARVAGRFGVSDAGRMAKEYAALFGEYPRTALAHSVRRRK